MVPLELPLDWPRIGVVVFVLTAVIAANVTTNLEFPGLADRVPVVGLAACLAIVIAIQQQAGGNMSEELRAELRLMSRTLAAALDGKRQAS